MIADIYELSPIQAGMLFHRVYAPESSAYFDQFSCELVGPIDAVLLQRAWQQLVDRHDVLRTSFHWEGLDKPVQVVHQKVELPWESHDWRGLSPETQTALWVEHLERDRATGFQPDAAPLMRCSLARLANARCYFSWSHHHLLLDGWCLTLVLAELFTRYESLKSRRAPSIGPVRPYREYIQWLQQRDRESVSAYWRDSLHGFSAPTPLPSLGIAPREGQTWADATADISLSPELSSDLRALAASRRLTLNTLMLGAWAILLSRYSGEPDVVFGTTVSGRSPELPGVETMLGVFINTVPARLQVDPAAHAGAWLAVVQSEQARRDSFATIALSEIQKLSDVEAGTPLFESNLIVMNYRLDDRLARGAAGIEVKDVRTFDHTDIPLTLQVTPGPRLSLELAYDSGRFDVGTIQRILGHLERLFAGFVADLDRPLSAFDILTSRERTELLRTFNATDAPLDPDVTIVDLWEQQVDLSPDAIALIHDGTRLSFRELNERANRLARGLLSLADLGRDDLVAIAFKRSDWTVAAILATWKCGAAYVPVDPDYPDDRIQSLLEDAVPRVVLRDTGSFGTPLEAAWSSRTRFASVQDLANPSRDEGATNLQRRAGGGDLAYVIFTSGSTGRPKGAMVEHLGLMNHMLSKRDELHLGPGTVVVQNASHCFDISVWQLVAAMVWGGTTTIYGEDLVLDPERFLARLESDRASILEVVPSYLSALLDRLDERPRPLRHLAFLIVTGEIVTPALLARWFASYPSVPAINAYGPTEATDDVAWTLMRELPATPTIPVGKPLRNFRIYIVDDSLNLCPIGIKGEICVSGAGVGRGYLNDPKRTASVFVEDPFRAERGTRMYRTGDVGCFLPDGTILMFGRLDHQVKVRGHRIELGDVEAAVTSLEGVRDAAVVDRRDRAEGIYLAAYVTLREGQQADDRTLLGWLADRLPEYMIPATCTILPEMPLTPNGKIDRKALPAPDLTTRPRHTAYAAPRSSPEHLLAAIWSEVLGVECPGIHDNFFALGGDSILSMQIASRALRAGFALTPRQVFQHQTIAELAEAAGAPRPLLPPTVKRTPGPAPLTPAQRQFFEDVTLDRDHYNQSIMLEVPDGIDIAWLDRALDAIVRHHDALRLRFAELDGRWEQSVAGTEAARVFSTHDVSSLPEGERARGLARIAGQLQAGLNIAAGPIIRAACVDLAASARRRLLLIVHHLAIDGVSWRVLLEDFKLACDQLARGEDVALPPTGTSFLQWADRLAALSQSDDIARDLDYWTAAPRRSIPSLPADFRAGAAGNTVESGVDLEIVFDEATTHALLTEAALAYKAGVTDLLIASVGRAFGDALGCRQLLVDVEAHGREHAEPDTDLTRTVGWFTSTFPILLDLALLERAAPADLVRLVKEALRSVPNHGASYGLLRHPANAPSRPSPLSAMPRAGVLFNYHGRADEDLGSLWRLSLDPEGMPRSPRQAREYVFEVNGFVSANQLRVTLNYSRHLHAQETAKRLGRAFSDAVTALVEACRRQEPRRWTPSDFPLARLGQPALDALAARADGVEDVYALSPTQQGMLFHALYEPLSQAYFNQLTCVLSGAIEVAAFQDAWRTVTDRHAALRTSFHWKDSDRPAQVVHAHVEIPWVVEDWTALSADAQERLWRRQLDEDRRRPFELSSPPLMRLGLCRVAPDTHWFHWSQHHLLLDGWSSSIVLNEVVSTYEALTDGRSFVPGPPRPFRDNVRWLQQQDEAAAERFWREQLDGFTSPTPLVLGLPEMEGRAGEGTVAEAEAALSGALTSALGTFCAANQITLNTLFQGIWSVCLGRHSGESDVVFGAIVSGRSATLDGSDEMVGVFINTIPVRARLKGTARLGDWLRALQRENVEREAYSHSALADVQRWSQVDVGTPLFDTILIFENYPVSDSLVGGGSAIQVSQVQAFEPNNYPLTFVVTPGPPGGIGIKIMYDGVRFDRDTIDRTLGHIQTLLAAIVERPDRTLDSLPLLAEEERRQILSWNRTGMPIPIDQTIVQVIESHARSTPERAAVVCDGRSLTYGALNARANQLARVLARAGSRGSEPSVAVLLRRSERWLETVLALWKSGAVYVPIDPDYPDERIATIVRSSRALLVVTDADALGTRPAASIGQQATTVLLDEIEGERNGEDASDLGRPPVLTGLAYVIFTSGSTGVPKGAMVEHVGMMNHILSMVGELAIGPSSRVAQTASHCFDISIWQLFAALVAGGTTVIYPERFVVRPAALAPQLESDRVTVVQFVPSYLNVFMDAVERLAERPQFHTLSHIVLIGEALKHASIARWFRLYPDVPMMNVYGPTEASDSIAHHDMAQPPTGSMVPVGRPIQNMALYIVDAEMRVCPIGVKGEIAVAGVGVGRGYLFDEERTGQVFLPDPFGGRGRLYKTGDVGCYAPDGTILFFGRRDFQVKVRGHRIELGEVESCLAALEGVRDAAVVVKDSGGDRFLCAWVTARAGCRFSEEEVTRALADRLPRHAIPDVVRVLAEMPLMPNGKVDRRALTKRTVDRAETRPQAQASNGIERQLIGIWREVLEQAAVGMDDTFFELGGHSLKAIQIASRIGRECGVEVGLPDIFEHNTIRALAQVVERASRATSGLIVPQSAQADYDTSSTQKRMWLSSRTIEGSVALNMAAAFDLEGALDIVALEHAFRALLERHESLRTVFALVAGSLRQRVLSAEAIGDVVRETDCRAEGLSPDDIVKAIGRRVNVSFDLARGPLVAAEVFRVKEEQSVLLVRMHHIIGDAFSIRILLQEALDLYAAFRDGAPNPLPPLPIQYRDFVAWQNRRAADGALELSREYWRRILAPDMPRSGFTPDKPRTSVQSFAAELADCDLDAALTARVRDAASHYSATVFSILVSSVFALLYRHTAQDDVVVGTEVGRRTDPQLERQIGCYIDTLVLRGHVHSDDTSGTLVARVARMLKDALGHQDYPFDSLLDDLNIRVPPGRTPVFDVLVNYVPRSDRVAGEGTRAGLRIAELPLDAEGAQYETAFLFAESDDGQRLSVRLAFSAALFDTGTADAMRGRLLKVLGWLADDRASTVGEIDLLARPAGRPRRLEIRLNAD